MKKILATMILLLLALVPAFAATSVASLKGTYNFQVFNVKGEYGYYCAPGVSGNCPWHNITNGQCPYTNGNVCENIYVQDLSVGTIWFSGAGTVKFLTFADGLGDGGPPVNVDYTYNVSGYTASFTLTGIKNGGAVCKAGTSNPCPVVTFSFGNLSSAGVAQTALILITNTGD